MSTVPAARTRSAIERVGPRPPGPSAPAADPPARVKLQVAMFLGQVKATEAQLLDAFAVVAERHERNYELSRGATTCALWSRRHLEWLEPFEKAYGAIPSENAEMLRSALLSGTRAGIVGEIEDLSDLAVLAERAEMTWTVLYQGAREIHDPGLEELAGRARDHNKRQIAWIRTQIDHVAPDALAVPLDPVDQVALSLPKRITAIASIPDPVWVPFMSAALILLVGLLGLATGRPWLGPSLGPTVILVTMMPAHPTARGWNIIAGHLIGLAAGIAAVALLGAQNAPNPIQTGQLEPVRVAAATLAILLTSLGGIIARASHPPAAATTLLVALGAIAKPEQVLATIVGVLIVAVAGEAVRRYRLDRPTPAERMAPPASAARVKLRGA
ncbi:MAG TPA: HPP family protein [Candidatus Limnocylindrales bacterium]|nr:HPP family protein [Candidatus Limnocylindrales bacterium]